MQCSVCGSQDTSIKRGVSKKNGRAWVAYDCNEPACKNEKGYPNRTFQPTPRTTTATPPQDLTLIHKKLDKILELIGYKKPKTILEQSEIMEPYEEESTPF